MSACVDEALLEQLVGLGIDVVDAAILVVGNPDQETVLKRRVTLQRLANSLKSTDSRSAETWNRRNGCRSTGP